MNLLLIIGIVRSGKKNLKENPSIWSEVIKMIKK